MPLVRLQNGTVVDTDQLAWQGGGSMFDSTRLAPPPFSPPPVLPPTSGLTTRKVSTYGVDSNGNPIMGQDAAIAAEMAKYGQGTNPDARATWGAAQGSIYDPLQYAGRFASLPTSHGAPSPYPQQTTRTASLPHPPDAPPRSTTGPAINPWRSIASASPVQTAAAPPSLIPPKNDPFGTFVTGQDQSRLPSNDGGEAGFLQAFGPGAPSNPALTAIDQLTGSGRSTAMPFPLMGFNNPRYKEPVEIVIQGGNQQQSLPGMKGRISPPSAPRPAGMPPPITFKRGDTVSGLAKRLGMTTSSFSDLYGISNPNKIFAGQTVAPRAPAMPMPGRPPSLSARSVPPVPRSRPRESFDQVWAEAKGY
jgi:hypothetical protein